ncbi:MAG: LacI family DNA-binding transcriptional regulator [Pseudomonadota bacterium]
MTRGSVTIEDVAKAAGVSRQTVSRVINRRTNVKEAVRERVEAAIAQLGYVPNVAARRMGGARSYLLLAVIERGAGAAGAGARTGRLPLDAMLLAGLDVCAQAGYHILFEQLEPDAGVSLAQLNRALTALSPDGVILTPPLEERSDLRDAVNNRGIALECLGERLEFGRPVPGIDDGALGEVATQHLLDLGHRQIGFVTGSADPRRSERRVSGYRRLMAQKGSRAHRHFTADGRLGFAEALALAKSWLVPTIRPTAIIAETEEVALAILNVAKELKIPVPRDLSILSLEERASLTRATPPVSSLFQPYERLFREGCEKLIARAEKAEGEQSDGSKDAKNEADSPFELIERKSIAKAPRAV